MLASVAQYAALAVVEKGASGLSSGQGPRTSHLTGLAVISLARNATRVDSPQLHGLVVYEQGPQISRGVGPFTSQLHGMVVWGSNVREQLNVRTWGFQLDGHTFYVLHLGMRGTFVYDATTKQWSQWKTQGFPTWNMENGHTWYGGRIVGGAEDGPQLLEIDPNGFLDEGFRTVLRIVTGLVSLRGRNRSIDVGALRVAAAMVSENAEFPRLRIRWSDDDGDTFEEDMVLDLEATTRDQSLDFRSLGTIYAPGRIFQIEDAGALITITDAELDIGDEDG